MLTISLSVSPLLFPWFDLYLVYWMCSTFSEDGEYNGYCHNIKKRNYFNVNIISIDSDRTELELELFFFSFIFISWRLMTLQYCSDFCHTLTWISYGFTCVPHPDPPSRLHPHPIPLGLPSAPALNTCLMHPTWAGDLFHPW